ncbi:MAG: tandem-95 repeat protein [Planctomycetes bacterium]|nr:tandem-95 repeat protein [Planctomycetota bacterium]
MSMFRGVKERAFGFLSGAWIEGGQRRDRLPSNRRSRFLSLESLENRKLLSVSPSAPPNADLADFAEPTAMVATADPTQGADTATVDFLAELDPSAEPTGSAPTVTDDTFSMTASQQLGAGVLANDTTGGGAELVVSLQTDVSHGQLSLAANGLFTYRPDAGFGGADTFTYMVSDGVHEAGPATVTIEVLAISNLGPQAADDAYLLGEDQPLVVSSTDGVLGNDNDLDGDPLSAVLVNAPGHGTLTLGEDGSFEYTPEADFHGEDSFSYVADDGQTESAVATVAITVEAVNDAPASVDDGYSVAEDGVLTVDVVGGVLANDSDIDGDPLAVTLVDGPSHGTVTLNEDGSFEYTPEADFHGEDSFSYVASDGQAESAVATVAITVEAVNDAPASVEDGYSVVEDGVLTVDSAGGVLANDSDIDGDPLAVTLVDGPSQGTVTLSDDGSFA